MWSKKFVTDEQIIQAADKAQTMSQAAKELGLEFKAFMRRAKKLDVYKPNQSGKGVSGEYHNTRRSEEELLASANPGNSKNFKMRLFRAGLKENKCEECGIVEWNGKPITLQLHHVDGNRSNNKLENLQILCPNCHTQTDNYAGKNLVKYREKQV